jgi:hypothetical protein
MKLSWWAISLLGSVLLSVPRPASAQAPTDQPAEHEIWEAYRSKVAQGGSWIPGLSWEARRINKIRGWKLKFKRLSKENQAGITLLRYRAVAKKNNVCAEYQIRDKFPPPYLTPRIAGMPDVEAGATGPCR